jgi:hypothetical protein
MQRFLIITAKQAFDAWLILVKLTIPALLAVRILTWFNLVEVISVPFEPIMGLMGLPKELALVWVTAMLTNNYTGVMIFLNISPLIGPISVAQATIMGTIILIAHNLPVEAGVCRGAGVSPLRSTVLRVAAAIIFGVLTFRLCQSLGWGTDEAHLVINFTVDPRPPWGTWFVSNVKSLAAIYFIVSALILLMAFLRKVRLIKLFAVILSPLMRLSGVGSKATMITIIGMVMGLAYGGGLIIAESKSGRIPKNDIYGSITLMALSHSLFEDTLVMASLGGSLWGLFVGRIVFSVAITGLIVRAARISAAQSFLIGRKYV